MKRPWSWQSPLRVGAPGFRQTSDSPSAALLAWPHPPGCSRHLPKTGVLLALLHTDGFTQAIISTQI